MENARTDPLSISEPIFNFAVEVAATSALSISVYVGFMSGYEAYSEGDYVIALKEWEPLAYRGDIEAQFALGMMYLNGDGVPRDEVHAYKWLNLAAADGDVQVKTTIDLAATRMMPDQIAEAQKLAREFNRTR
jgi:hypothetical protein